MWTDSFNALSALVCMLSVILSIWNVRIAVRQRESLVRRTRSLESSVESLTRNGEEMLSTIAEVSNRVKMMKVRAAANHTAGSSGEPDPYRNPDEWRKSMNSRIQKAKMGL